MIARAEFGQSAGERVSLEAEPRKFLQGSWVVGLTDLTLIWSDPVNLGLLAAGDRDDSQTTDRAAATMIVLICAGWIPHDDDAPEAASV
jgi:hypothetical protein